MIPYGRQDITEDDIESVIDVLRSDFLTQGQCVPKFENRVSEYVGSSHAVAVNSATSALHLSCMALGLGPGDIVWTSCISFVASSNCALYCGAVVDFLDIDSATYNICCKKLRKKLQEAKLNDNLPKIIIPVHLTGQSCDMKEIYELSQEFGFKIIEDASHAIGGEYRDKRIGSCIYSDACVFSFHPVKIITTGEGGMITTNDSILFSKIEALRSHGIIRDENLMKNASHGPWYYEQVTLGFNYRITDIQAALGLSQLKRLDEYVLRRNALARNYDRELFDLPLTIPYQADFSYSSRHLYVIRLDLARIKKSHLDVFNELRKNNIGVQIHYIPIPMQPYYEEMGFDMMNFPNSIKYYEEAITIPLYPLMSEEEQDQVISSLRKIVI